MGIGIQLLALIFIIAILGQYLSKKRISLISSKVFTCFLIASALNICFEILTLYALRYYETTPLWVVRLTHQFFIGSLDVAMLFIFLYVDLKSRSQKRYTPVQLFIRMLPTIVAIFMVLFGPLEYQLEGVRYSYGWMALSVYATSGIYIVWTILLLVRKDIFTNETKRMILVGIALWAIAALIQFFVPTSLISSMGVSLMVLFLYLSFENPKEFLDHIYKNVLNVYAFDLVVQEVLGSNQKKILLYIVLPEVSTLKSTLGEVKTKDSVQLVLDKLQKEVSSEIYHMDFNTFATFVDKSKLRILRQEPISEINYNIFGIEVPTYVTSLDFLKSLFGYLNQEPLENRLTVLTEEDINKYDAFNQIANTVVNAIYEERLEVYFQPIYSTRERKITACEALVRLNDPYLGFISPDVFIPIVEQRGLIDKLDTLVLHKVCQYYKEYEFDTYGIEYVEINVSGLEITNFLYPKEIKSILKNYDLDSRRINIEITETTSTLLEEQLRDNVDNLHLAGFQFSMDDFGTGYSNLSKISEIPFDIIKLDKSLLWPYFKGKDYKSKGILDFSIELIHNLNIQVVAEGIETKEMVDYLTSCGVEYLQGYYFSKPLPVEAFIKYIQEQKK